MWLFSKKDNSNDEQLAKNYFLSGDKSIVGKLFENHVKTVYGVCLYYFRDKDVAKDAVMQIFEKLIVELRRTEIKNFKGWLSFVVRNYCINELRRNKGKRFVPENYLDFEIKDPDAEEEDKIMAVNEELMLQHMKMSLPELKEKQRVCIQLFYLEGKSYEEVAKQTAYGVGEVKSYIQNGKRNLKILIESKLKSKKNAA